MLEVYDLKTESEVNPLGFDESKPRFSWKIKSDEQDVMQTAYELNVQYNDKVIWETGKVTSDQSLYIPYDGPEIQSNTKYYWKVRIWDNKGKLSQWSELVWWEMGLLKPSDWKAKWIDPEQEIDLEAFKPCIKSDPQATPEVFIYFVAVIYLFISPCSIMSGCKIIINLLYE